MIAGGIALAWPDVPALRGQEAGLLPATIGSGPNSGVAVQPAHGGYGVPCPEPPALALLGFALLLIVAVRMARS